MVYLGGREGSRKSNATRNSSKSVKRSKMISRAVVYEIKRTTADL